MDIRQLKAVTWFIDSNDTPPGFYQLPFGSLAIVYPGGLYEYFSEVENRWVEDFSADSYSYAWKLIEKF